jgi:hypothetical protein
VGTSVQEGRHHPSRDRRSAILIPLELHALFTAVGLLLGLLGVRPIGIAAALGLVAFFIGAVATHVRARVFYNIAFPMAYLALAIASLVVLL